MEAFDSASYSDKRKQLRTAAHPELEDAVLRWIRNACDVNANLPVSGPLICAQVERFAEKMNIEEIKASEGWLARFKSGHNLTFKSVCGERAAV
ncbi:hypothetical protein HPB49_001411 [Dermacentor silvarum]|uniref:Uncharacterized protein n=1 Tax=Dermacentor silvarum TaxID=543639 RepID=A0ACB8DTH2_DERSI|nr:hypothetical protein HPB49_001411 [Dermacentor silvarum]